MAGDPWSQHRYDLRFEWGPVGAARVSAGGGVLVVVDVLSFTTAVSVAVERGTTVHPAPWRDGRAQALADELGAALAVGRRDRDEHHPWTLSPAALRDSPAPARLVLPSPNGSAIAAAASGPVVAACLRNARAVGRWLSTSSSWSREPITVIAAGEQWPDGSLRPALEDALGAGAVLAAITDFVPGRRVSPEARAVLGLYESTASLADAVYECGSGVELRRSGFARDVDIALELDASSVVPVLVDGAFRPAP